MFKKPKMQKRKKSKNIKGEKHAKNINTCKNNALRH